MAPVGVNVNGDTAGFVIHGPDTLVASKSWPAIHDRVQDEPLLIKPAKAGPFVTN